MHFQSNVNTEEFFALSLDLLCVASLEGYFLRINPAFTETLGYSEQDLLKTPFTDFIHPDDLERTLLEMKSLEDGNLTLGFENRYRCKDGSFRWLSWRANARPESGLIYAVATDITERRKTEEKLRLQTIMLKRAEMMAKVGHWRVELPGMEIYWSDEIYRIHGLDPDHYTPEIESAIDAYHPEDRPAVEKFVQASIETGAPFEFKFRLLRPDQEVRHVWSRGECLKDDTGQPIALFGVFLDITESLEAQAHLSATNARLGVLNKDLYTLAFAASHDLRTPVRSVVSFSHLLRTDQTTQLSEKGDQYLGFIESAGRTLQTLLASLLTYLNAGAKPQKFGPISLDALIDEVSSTYDSLSCQRSKLPPLVGDLENVRLLIENLFSNAEKFGGEQPRVEIQGEQDGEGVTLSFSDNGPGIPEAHHQRVFKAFQKLQAEPNSGAGMGLAVCKKIVEAHHGRIWLAPSETGTTIRVFLPLTP